ncbi:MAG: hypothetical protein KDK25_02665 [Leptospiraceae bacterium]|nr:hypothetical protein [Leptospiraceae bacterium]
MAGVWLGNNYYRMGDESDTAMSDLFVRLRKNPPTFSGSIHILKAEEDNVYFGWSIFVEFCDQSLQDQSQQEKGARALAFLLQTNICAELSADAAIPWLWEKLDSVSISDLVAKESELRPSLKKLERNFEQGWLLKHIPRRVDEDITESTSYYLWISGQSFVVARRYEKILH